MGLVFKTRCHVPWAGTALGRPSYSSYKQAIMPQHRRSPENRLANLSLASPTSKIASTLGPPSRQRSPESERPRLVSPASTRTQYRLRNPLSLAAPHAVLSIVLRGAWSDRDTNDIFAHCSLIFYFLDFKFSNFVCPSELHPLIWFFLKIPSGKRKISEKPPKTP